MVLILGKVREAVTPLIFAAKYSTVYYLSVSLQIDRDALRLDSIPVVIVIPNLSDRNLNYFRYMFVDEGSAILYPGFLTGIMIRNCFLYFIDNFSTLAIIICLIPRQILVADEIFAVILFIDCDFRSVPGDFAVVAIEFDLTLECIGSQAVTILIIRIIPFLCYFDVFHNNADIMVRRCEVLNHDFFCRRQCNAVDHKAVFRIFNSVRVIGITLIFHGVFHCKFILVQTVFICADSVITEHDFESAFRQYVETVFTIAVCNSGFRSSVDGIELILIGIIHLLIECNRNAFEQSLTLLIQAILIGIQPCASGKAAAHDKASREHFHFLHAQAVIDHIIGRSINKVVGCSHSGCCHAGNGTDNCKCSDIYSLRKVNTAVFIDCDLCPSCAVINITDLMVLLGSVFLSSGIVHFRHSAKSGEIQRIGCHLDSGILICKGTVV